MMDVCEICWDWRIRWRDDLVELWLRAHAALPPGNQSGLTEKVAISKPDSGMPLREGPLMAMETSLNLTETWAHILLRRGCPGAMPTRGRVRDAFLFQRSVDLLAAHDHELTGSPLAGEYWCDLNRAYWALARVDNRRAQVVSLRTPCPNCDRTTVIERNAGEHVLCLTCGATWSQAGYAAHARPTLAKGA